MIDRLRQHLTDSFPFLEGKKLLLAVSGGLDSMVLTQLFCELRYNVSVAHCNFKLREQESDDDEIFVEKICLNLGIPFYSQSFDTEKFAQESKLSIQLAARQLRYEWFSELIDIHEFDYLLTAHHLDDNVETFLINFTRGTGLEGLTGIPQQNGKIIRPFLIFPREEIRGFAVENNLNWREDSSNASDKYLRNKLRHDVLPLLKSLNPGFLNSFEKTIYNLQQAQSLVDDASRIVYRKVVEDTNNQKIINLDELLQLSNYKAYLYQWLNPFGFSAWNDIYDLVNASSGKQIFSEDYVLLKDRNTLIIFPKQETSDKHFWIEENQQFVKFPINLSISKVSDISHHEVDCIFVDKDKLCFPLEIRKWKEGDYFYPFGMKGKKKVSKYFKDEKMSLIEKAETWLLCSDNQIVWIIGKRQDERFKIAENTKNILQIRLH